MTGQPDAGLNSWFVITFYLKIFSSCSLKRLSIKSHYCFFLLLDIVKIILGNLEYNVALVYHNQNPLRLFCFCFFVIFVVETYKSISRLILEDIYLQTFFPVAVQLKSFKCIVESLWWHFLYSFCFLLGCE